MTISWRNAPLFTPHLLVLETIVCTQDFNALALLVYRFLNVEHFFSRLVEAVVISFVLQRCCFRFLKGKPKADNDDDFKGR